MSVIEKCLLAYVKWQVKGSRILLMLGLTLRLLATIALLS